MNLGAKVTQKQLMELLLNVAVIRPVFIWGAPGIGKSSLVEEFARQVGLSCVSLLGSQLAPEDIMGVPQIVEGKTRFCPPTLIAKDEPYCLFLDELNACSHEVQKSFYSLIHDRRVGDYTLPKGSIVIGAGNRAQDSAIVKTMSSALVNRMFHAQLHVSHKEWLEWAIGFGIHPFVIEYLQIRPDQLWTEPPKHEEPFSTPRSWHMLSDILYEYGEDNLSNEVIGIVASGCISPQHASQFQTFHKQIHTKYHLNKILNGDMKFPSEPENRDVLYFLAQSFRAQIIKELPGEKEAVNGVQRQFAHQAKALIKDLASISHEIAQLVVSSSEKEKGLPDWFMTEIIRDLPRLAERKDKKDA
jgi:hypothetical protein